MKKACTNIALLLTILILFSSLSFAYAYPLPIEPAVLTPRDISMAEAITLAREQMMQYEGMSHLDLSNYFVKASFVRLDTDENAWVIMLDEKEYGTDTLFTFSADGKRMLDYQSTNTEITALLVQLWKSQRGEMKTWSVEEKALFNWMFGDETSLLLPDENCINREKAGEIAIREIGHPFSLNDCCYSFGRLSYTDPPHDRFIWMVTIVVNGQETYLVYVDAISGKVIEKYHLDGNG